MIKNLYQYWLISKSGIFDRNYYLLTYPDVRAADVNPLWHFIKIGWKEGRNPTGFFDTKFYLENNPDVRINGINPLVHYIKFGLKEGRKPRLELGESRFDENVEYKIVYPDDISQTSAEDVDEIKEINATVSVIIPTKNAGDDFEFLLKMLKNQVGIKKIEIVIVDSGSEDETINLSKIYDAKLVSIAPEDFSHSYSRNIGGENATGDYLLFTVQDALPPTKTWLYELLKILINNKLSAVSCAEIPSENADLFYRVISWNHYEFLEVNARDQIRELPEVTDYKSLRQNGQLSDLACLIPKEIFDYYHYELDYAEDLDLGIRLIKSGHKIAFLGSIRIIHSHNRSTYYFLKRGYVDNLFLSEIFSDYEIPKSNIKELIPDILFTYTFLSTQLTREISNLTFPYKVSKYIELLRDIISTSKSYTYPNGIKLTKSTYVDENFHKFLMDLETFNHLQEIKINLKGLLIQALSGYMEITFKYLSNSYELIDQDLSEEIIQCIFKEFSIIIGAHLSFCFHTDSPKDEIILHIHSSLKQGI